jgi:hypothetical protein
MIIFSYRFDTEQNARLKQKNEHSVLTISRLCDYKARLSSDHLFLIIIDIFVLTPFWLVYMETYGIDFLSPVFVIFISKHLHHHHHHRLLTDIAARASVEVYI